MATSPSAIKAVDDFIVAESSDGILTPSVDPNVAHSGSINPGIPIRYRTISLTVDQSLRTKKPKQAASGAAENLDIGSIRYHLNRVEDVCTKFSTHPTLGLDSAAVTRKAADGKNKISPPPTRYLQKALTYIFGGFNFLMWIAFILTILSYEPLGGSNPQVFNLGLAMVILFAIFLASIFYAIVDWNASRAMKNIVNLAVANATVVRDGTTVDIPATNVVVGDLLQLSLGQRVAADIRIVQCSPDAQFDRSILTGESKPVAASVDPTDENPLETLNLAFSSTFLVQGSALGVVFAIGDNTVMGQLVASAGKTKTELTTIQKELNMFTIIISGFALTFFTTSMIIYVAWVKNSYPNYETISGAIVNSIGCLTAFVPEGLPVAVALSLSIIARRMAKKNVLVKNLATVETLGCMSILCSDKTGTLTMGKMRVTSMAVVDAEFDNVDSADGVVAARSKAEAAVEALCVAGRLCNAARFEPGSEHLGPFDRPIKGDPTDTAVLRFVEDLGGATGDAVAASYTRLFEIPFNSKNKWMATVVKNSAKSDTSATLLIKGAPDFLLSRCTSALNANGQVVPLDETLAKKIAATQERWASMSQRVLALCQRDIAGYKDFSRSASDIGHLDRIVQAEIQGLTLVALIGIRDPPRAEVPDAIKVIRKAGVRVFMVTGDFISTASAIARQVGILTAEHCDGADEVRRLAKEYQLGEGEGGKLKQQFSSKSLVRPSFEEQMTSPRGLALTGSELNDFGDADWEIVFGRYSEIVFARTSPDQKLAIVTRARALGDNTVAVTGDGVNDAPALKAADIGVAMGAGSDVAKEAAAMVLLTNDFTAITVAIENGRLVFDNIKKVILYLMPAGSYSEFLAVVSNVFFGMQMPMNSYLMVFLCVFNDVVMSLSLMFELAEADLMSRPPRNVRRDRLTDWRFFIQVYLFVGLMMWMSAMSSWFIFFSGYGIHFHDLIGAWNSWGYYGGSYNYVMENSAGFSLGSLNASAGIDVTQLGIPASYAIPTDFSTIPTNYTSVLQDPANGIMGALPGYSDLMSLVYSGNSVYYVCLIIVQYGDLLAIRNRRVSLLQSNPLWGPRRNLFVVVGMVCTLLFGFLNVFTPGIQTVFLTGDIPVKFWFIPLSFAVGLLLMDEMRKLISPTANNAFLDWGLQRKVFLDPAARTAVLWDGGEHLVSMTRLAAIGRAVVGVLRNPDETRNRTVNVHEVAASLKEILAIAQELAPPASEWTVSTKSTQEAAEASRVSLARKEISPAVFMGFLARAGFRQDVGHFKKNDNRLLGIETLSPAEFKSVVIENLRLAM
ncbi:hypothetical protein HK405_015740 [Cladochytrium tenue]|nr:hypothetical protein HK405_015740 [Cladochytrium tenue]